MRTKNESAKSYDKSEEERRTAKEYYDEALTMYDEIQSRLGPANCHRGRGDILAGKQRAEEYDKSEKSLLEAFDRKDVTPWFTFGDDYRRWRR